MYVTREEMAHTFYVCVGRQPNRVAEYHENYRIRNDTSAKQTIASETTGHIFRQKCVRIIVANLIAISLITSGSSRTKNTNILFLYIERKDGISGNIL